MVILIRKECLVKIGECSLQMQGYTVHTVDCGSGHGFTSEPPEEVVEVASSS